MQEGIKKLKNNPRVKEIGLKCLLIFGTLILYLIILRLTFHFLAIPFQERPIINVIGIVLAVLVNYLYDYQLIYSRQAKQKKDIEKLKRKVTMIETILKEHDLW